MSISLLKKLQRKFTAVDSSTRETVQPPVVRETVKKQSIKKEKPVDLPPEAMRARIQARRDAKEEDPTGDNGLLLDEVDLDAMFGDTVVIKRPSELLVESLIPKSGIIWLYDIEPELLTGWDKVYLTMREWKAILKYLKIDVGES
jgi:hypothetical protein